MTAGERARSGGAAQHGTGRPLQGSRRVWWLVLLTVGGAAVLWGVTRARGAAGARDARERPGRPRATGDMPGMPGMSVTASGSVRLTAEQLRRFGVTFGVAAVRPLDSETRTTGVVTVDERRVVQVAPKFAGFAERLYASFTGQAVRRGQPLLDIYAPELLAAQQELLLARQLQQDIGRSAVPGVPVPTTDLVEAAKRRLRLWDISESQIDEVLRLGRPRRVLTLSAPAGGVVIDKRVVQGQAIGAGEPLYTIADLSGVWIDARLREADAAAVRVGSRATVEVPALPGRVFAGRVEFVYPVLDSVSRAVRARLSVPNAGGALRPGMYGTVRLITPDRAALTVPRTAVLRTGDRDIVFVDGGGGALVPREVRLGRAAGEYLEVLAGLAAGQRVVTSAQFLLDSESNLGEVMRSMLGQGGSAKMGDMPMGDMPMGDMPMGNMPGMDMKGADMRNMPGMATVPAAPGASRSRGREPR